MTRFTKAAAAFAALTLTAGASAASAQNYGFTHPGELVTARGRVTQEIQQPGYSKTQCDIIIYGAVSEGGERIVFDSYDGQSVVGDNGNMPCHDVLELPITVNSISANVINVDEIVFGLPGLYLCQVANYSMSYVGGSAVLSDEYFGAPYRCRISGSLNLTADATGVPVNIVALP